MLTCAKLDMEPEPDPRYVKGLAPLFRLLEHLAQQGSTEDCGDHCEANEGKDGAEGDLLPKTDAYSPEEPYRKADDSGNQQLIHPCFLQGKALTQRIGKDVEGDRSPKIREKLVLIRDGFACRKGIKNTIKQTLESRDTHGNRRDPARYHNSKDDPPDYPKHARGPVPHPVKEKQEVNLDYVKTRDKQDNSRPTRLQHALGVGDKVGPSRGGAVHVGHEVVNDSRVALAQNLNSDEQEHGSQHEPVLGEQAPVTNPADVNSRGESNKAESKEKPVDTLRVWDLVSVGRELGGWRWGWELEGSSGYLPERRSETAVNSLPCPSRPWSVERRLGRMALDTNFMASLIDVVITQAVIVSGPFRIM